MKRANLSVSTSGRLQLDRIALGPMLWLRFKLRFVYGLCREGSRIENSCEKILPDFVSEHTRLRHGYDDESAYYLLATNAAGDAILQQLAKSMWATGKQTT